MANIVLGIESSCDETSASICLNGKIINNIVVGQSIHEQYGGVVPELASREHQKNIIPAIQLSLSEAQIKVSDLDAIAVTQGPGLLGALLVGYSFAKALALSIGKPLINVNHLKAHVLAHFIEEPTPDFPFICLTVSGGHTQIVLVKNEYDFEIIGQSIDDAAGEAFDKGAKLLDLPYPGGPLIDQLSDSGDSDKFEFAESNIPNLDFSFSGIKTSLLYFLRKEIKNDPNFVESNKADLAASYQKHIINMLTKKLVKASENYGIQNIGISGGVAANKSLRSTLTKLAKTHSWNLFIPKFEYCTDNAAMVAMAGYIEFKRGNFASLRDQPRPRFPIDNEQ